MAAIRSRLNLWFALGLIAANLFTWGQLLLAVSNPHVVEPIMDPEIRALLDYIHSGEHSGETWEVTLTELEAEQTITWYLNRYPQIPFAYPQIKITPDSISGEGDVIITGLHFHVSGEARVTLENGLPVVEILELDLPLPASMKDAIEREIQTQLQRAERLPVRFTSAEWGDGVVVVRGVIR
ncbi:MAG: hypothetical protein L6Q26_08520 [Anaerolineales bacterium]|nr:hypothetical protein [Anaerolineales bacterium]NUQ83681.1 hypothetical protein [Anaerolineales bacterium]